MKNKIALIMILVLAVIIFQIFSVSALEAMPTGGTGINIINSSAEETFVAPIEYDPAPAQPGQYVTLFIKAENSGGDEIKDAYYQLELEYPFSFKTGEKAIRYFGAIGGKQQVQLEYDLFVDKNVIAGQYPVYLKLCSDSSCNTGIKKEILINVRTGGVPKVEVGFEEFDIFTSGMKGQITLHVINRGNLDTKFLLLELAQTNDFQVLSPNKIYIGELNSDDFETATFDIYLNEKLTSDKLMLPVTLTYTDVNDKDYSESIDLYLNVYSNEDLLKIGVKKDYSGIATGMFVLILILIIAGAGYFIYRKKIAK